ncbi:Replication factor A protein-like protein [Hapsidospora chrysogenum ATCC 11550]|uniref:Replication factor A protein-like protein n=1 Tax=Hapsidospora chrysogenum (strain ATCC 11550 / CBS 779.69 / DSM 880 / IAM 14645 / JCM 23072 / IMI 49137) TaxID=857340 RepID=A0A086T2U6_HAPC1|nr:Replication factor A protein-like protein [Hapsidospora chrysogenum ATCC 11550]
MAEQLSTPRITAPYLDNFVGRHVLLMGKVTQLRGDEATIDSDGAVTVSLNRDAHLANGNVAQVIGKVNPDLSIKVLSCKDLGPNVARSDSRSEANPPHDALALIDTPSSLDLGLYASVVEVTHQHKSIFVSES